MCLFKAGQRTKKERQRDLTWVSVQQPSPLTFNRSGFLSVLSSSGRDGDGDGGHGTTVAFWPVFTAHFYTPSHSQVCVLTYSVGGVGRYQHICPRVTKNSHNYKLKRTSQKDQVLPMYSIFIYLFDSPTFIHSRKGLHKVSLLVFSNYLLDIHTVTFKRGSARRKHGFNCSPEELQVECLTQGHLNTSEC